MSAELELERLVVRLVGDATGYVRMLNEAENRTKQFAQTMQGAFGGGPGGGGGGGGSGAAGGDASRRQRESLAANTLKMEARQKEAAARSLDNQRQRAYEKDLKDQEAAAKAAQTAQAARQKQSDTLKINSAKLATQQGEQESRNREAQAKKELDSAKKSSLEGAKQVAADMAKLDQAQALAAKQVAQDKAKGQKNLDAQQERDDRQARREYMRGLEEKRRANERNQRQEQQQLDRDTRRLTRDEERRQRQSDQLKINSAKLATREAEKREKEETRLAKAALVQRERDAREAQVQRNEVARRSAQTGQNVEAVTLGVGKTAGVISAPLLLGMKMSVDAFGDFDKAMTESTSIMKVTDDETKKMRDTALSLSMAGIQGPEQLAKSFYFMASAGMDAQQAIAAIPQVQAFATAGAFDLATATSLLNDTQKALGMSSKDAEQNLVALTRVTDVLVKGAAMSNANIQQLSMSMSRTAGAALKAFNKDIEEGVAVLGAFADQGVKGELAGNRLSMFLRHLSASTLAHRHQQKQLGFEVFDSTGKMRNMADIIQNLEQVLAPMSGQMRAAALQAMGFEARMQQAILPLIGTSSVIREYERDLRSVGGYTQEVAAKQMQAFSNQLQTVINTVKVASIIIGEQLAPVVTFLAEGVKMAVQWFLKLDPTVKAASVAVVAFTTLALAGIASLILGFKAINILTGGFPLIVGLLVTGFAALGATVGAIVVKMGGFNDAMNALRSYAMDAWDWFKPLLPALESLWFSIVRTADTALTSLGSLAKAVWKKISGDAEVDWKKVRDVIQDSILFAEFSLNNLESTAERVWIRISHFAAAHISGMNNRLLWVLPRVGLGMGPIPPAVEQAIGLIEETLERQMKEMQGRTSMSFAEFRQQWIVEQGIGKGILKPGDPEVVKAVSDAGRAGEGIGASFVDGVKKGLQKFDSAEFGSAEATARIATYAALLNGQGGGGDLLKLGKGGAKVRLPDELNRGGKGEGDPLEKQNQILNNINKGIQDAAKKAGKSINVALSRF